MLKIGSIQWKGKCSRHSFYRPDEDGEAGIKGGCPRCLCLLSIYQQHTRLVLMMREFGSGEQKRKPKAMAEAVGGYQTLLFEIPDTDSYPPQRQDEAGAVGAAAESRNG